MRSWLAALRGRPRTFGWARISVDALTLLGVIVAAAYWLQLTTGGGNPVDARTYYGIRLDDLYGGWVLGAPDAFQYAPVVAQAIHVWRILPFEAFVAVWRAAELVCLAWLAGPLTLPLLFWGPVASEVNAGNVNLFLAAAIAAGFRHPGSWAFVLLTKVTPGVGLLWFVVRRELAAVRIAAVVTACIVVVSFVIMPGQWIAWLGLLGGHAGQAAPSFPFWIPLFVRLPIGILVILLGARLGWRASVAVGATIAAPMLYFPTQSMILGALPSIREAVARRSSRGSDPEVAVHGYEIPTGVRSDTR
jgi:hypothetical protein